MPFTSSAEEVAVEREPDLRRSRSHGHGNFWEQQQAKERYKHELQLQRRQHLQHRSGPSLEVPSVPYSQHRSQRQSRNRDRWEEEDVYVRAPTEPKSTEPPIQTGSQRRPSIKVEIHQEKPARASSPPRSFSPMAGVSLVDLRLDFDKIITKLADVSALCSRKRDGDGDSPKGLSFGGIAAQLNGDSFRLKVWGYEVGLEKWTEIDSSREKHVETALRMMQRMSDRAKELGALCAKAKFRDLKLPDIEPDRHWEDYDSDNKEEWEDEPVEDPTEFLGFEIKSCLDSISLQIQTLSRLTRPLQDATYPDGFVNEEVKAIGGLVAEVSDFFGSPEALRQHSINEKFGGKKALEEARYTAGLR